MYIRKHGKKYQCLVRVKGVSVSQSFYNKSDASRWGKEKEVEIENGTYVKDLKLTSMRLKDLLQLYLEKALHKTRRPKILKYEVEMLRRTPLARNTLALLSPKRIAEFRDDRLKAGKSRSTVRAYLKTLSRAITIGRKELGIPLTHNPFELVEKPKPNAARERTLEPQELKQLFKVCDANSSFHFLGTFAEIFPDSMFERVDLSDFLDEFSFGSNGVAPGYAYTYSLDDAFARQSAFLTADVVGSDVYEIGSFDGFPVNKVEEETISLYVSTAWNFVVSDYDVQVNLGVRYEETDIVSPAKSRVVQSGSLSLLVVVNWLKWILKVNTIYYFLC